MSSAGAAPSFTARENALGQLVFLLIAAGASYYFSQLRFGLTGQLPEVSIDRLMAGTAQTPEQYRVLIPWLAKGIIGIFKLLPTIPTPAPITIFQYIELLCVLLVFVAFRYLVSLFLGKNATSGLLAITVWYGMLFHYVIPPLRPGPASPINFAWWKVADVPALLFMTVGLVLLYKKKWMAYYAIFVLATINRETSCYLTFIYLFTALGKSNLRSISIHCLLQFSIWFVIKYLLYQLYIDNPVTGPGPSNAAYAGLFDATDFRMNMADLRDIRLYPVLFSIAGYLWIPALLLGSIMSKDFIRKATIVIFPYFAGMSVLATLFELRTFGDLVSVLAAAFVLVLGELLVGKPVSTVGG